MTPMVGEHGRRRLFTRAFSVLNREQADGDEAPAHPILPESKRLGLAVSLFVQFQIQVLVDTQDAHYRIDQDRICMPLLVASFHPRISQGPYFTRQVTPPARSTDWTAISGRGYGDRTRTLEKAVAELTALHPGRP